MKTLDLFNSQYERNLHEGATDSCDTGAEMRGQMASLVERARRCSSMEERACLMREYAELKEAMGRAGTDVVAAQDRVKPVNQYAQGADVVTTKQRMAPHKPSFSRGVGRGMRAAWDAITLEDDSDSEQQAMDLLRAAVEHMDWDQAVGIAHEFPGTQADKLVIHVMRKNGRNANPNALLQDLEELLNAQQLEEGVLGDLWQGVKMTAADIAVKLLPRRITEPLMADIAKSMGKMIADEIQSKPYAKELMPYINQFVEELSQAKSARDFQRLGEIGASKLDGIASQLEKKYKKPTIQQFNPVDESQKKSSEDLGAIKDPAIQQAIKLARARYPAADSDVEAFIKDTETHLDQDEADIDQEQDLNTKQEAMLQHIMDLDKKQSSDIEDIKGRLSDVNKRLNTVLGKIQSKSVDEAGTMTPGHKPGWALDPKTKLELKKRRDQQKIIAKWAGKDVPKQDKEQSVNELDVNTLKSYADKRGAQVAAMKADNPNPQTGSKEWVQQAVPAQKVGRAQQKIARKERQQGVAEGWSGNEPTWVCINGKRWKKFPTHDHARNVGDKLQAKFRHEGRKDRVTYDTDLEDLEEVSKQTLGSYVKRAGQDIVQRATGSSYQSGAAGDKYNKAEPSAKELRRERGIERAVSKLTK